MLGLSPLARFQNGAGQIIVRPGSVEGIRAHAGQGGNFADFCLVIHAARIGPAILRGKKC